MRRLLGMIGLLGLFWLPGLKGAQAAEAPRLLEVEPGRLDDQIVCRLHTRGLPDDRQLQTMRSGLESAVEFQLVLLDDQGEAVAARSVLIRLAFDLWDEVYAARLAGQEWRFGSLADLQEHLARLQDIPVATTAGLNPGGLYRIKAGLVVYALAPEEQQKVEDVIVGSRRDRREGQDQQEASVSLGRLIRLFYKGDDERGEGQALLSAWFMRRDLLP